VPRMCSKGGQCVMYSERLGWIHWWLTTIGFVGFFAVLTAAGLTQAGSYAQGIPTVMVLPAVRSLWIGRAVSGSMIIGAQYIFAYNLFRTMRGMQSVKEQEALDANEAVEAAGA
jgi:cbb3-type cytochrome oxidase subunit 1